MNELTPKESGGEFLLYQTEDGQTRIEVRLENETVWLNQLTMAELFQTSKQNISLHLKNIFNEGALAENRVVKEYLTTAADGKGYHTKFYSLEAIIAVGYRVRSHRGTQFRRWATEGLNEYLVKGFTMDDDLKTLIPVGDASENNEMPLKTFSRGTFWTLSGPTRGSPMIFWQRKPVGTEKPYGVI